MISNTERERKREIVREREREIVCERERECEREDRTGQEKGGLNRMLTEYT